MLLLASGGLHPSDQLK